MTIVYNGGARTNYGPRMTEKQQPSYESNYGEIKEIVLNFSFDQTVPPAVGNGLLVPADDALDLIIPAQSHILSARWSTQVAFAGGTNYTVGLNNAATGAVISANALFLATDTVLANINAAGKWVKGAGAFVDPATDNNLVSANAVISITPTGTFTAGVAKLVINFLKV